MEVRRLIKVLKKNGWKLDRQSGSHMNFKKGNKLVTIPNHKKEIKIGTLISIEKSTGLKFH